MTPVLPPGPSAGRLAQTVALHRDPLGFLRRGQAEFGDVFTIRLATTGPVVVLAHPDMAAELPPTDPQFSCAGAARRGVLPMASPRSVFGGDGDAHQAARARIEGCFSPDHVAELRGRIDSIAERHVAGWPRRRPFRLLPRMRRLADEVFVKCVLGVDDDELVRGIGSMLHTPGNPPLTIPGPDDGLAGPLVHAAYRRRRRRVAGRLATEIARRRSAGEPGPGVLGRVVADEPGVNEEEIVEELLSLLMAAQEPMASALTWLSLLGAHDEASIEDGLKRRPPALGSLRELRAPRTVGGFDLPAGTSTMVPIQLVQNDPRGSAHIPFGGGARQCIAQPLARAELAAVLPLVRGVRPVGEERPVLRATILVPQRSGLVAPAM